MPRYRNNFSRDRGSNLGGFIFLFFILGGFGVISGILSVVLPLLPIIALFYFLFNSNKNINNNKMKTNYYSNIGQRTNYSQTLRKTNYDSKRSNIIDSHMDEINDKLDRYFDENEKLNISGDINLRLKTNDYISPKSLNVYKGDNFVSTFEELSIKYPKLYEQIMKYILSLKLDRNKPNSKKVKQEVLNEEEYVDKYNTSSFIDKINLLNNDIPDEDISNGLYETSSLLSQLENLSKKDPKKSEKLDKLYKYYLPMLVKNLEQFTGLQYVKNDDLKTTQDKLKKNISLVNEAIKSLASSLYEDDFINLSADMNTLESLLKNDGYDAASNINSYKGGNYER